jgi:glutathione S-transferase
MLTWPSNGFSSRLAVCNWTNPHTRLVDEAFADADIGQGPYFGQAVWFTKFHSEQLESAKERYYAEIKRVTSVLEDHLKKQEKGTDGPWLVGNKYSYADLSFVPWHNTINGYLKGVVDLSEFTEVAAWFERLTNRAAIKKVVSDP